MINRLGGRVASHERWLSGDVQLETVNEYKYLGNLIKTKLASSSTQMDLANRAKAGLALIHRTLRKISHVTPDVYFRLSDAQIQPILLYGSEVWGFDCCNRIENIHRFALKSFLNVSSRTPNMMACGETGRYPLYVNAIIRSVKYWLKIIYMDEFRLPRRVYEMMRCKKT